MMFMLTGCATINNCPTFPEPNAQAVQDLRDLNSPDVNKWVVELFKLQLKLEAREQYERND